MPVKILYAYVGRDADGTIQALVADQGTEVTAASVAELITDGMTVEHVPLDWARTRLCTADRFGREAS